MRTGVHPSRRRSLFLVAAGVLTAVLTACTGRGGGQLPPSVGFTGAASFGFSFSCEDSGGINPPTGQLRIQLSYTEQGTSLIGSPFGIHGTADVIDSVLESQLCQGQNPSPGGSELIFLGRYRLTSSVPAGVPAGCRDTTSETCRFEVIVRDNDRNRAPSPGDYFSIKLSSVTAVFTDDCPPGGTPPCVITEFPVATVFYARAGTLSAGNLTVD